MRVGAYRRKRAIGIVLAALPRVDRAGDEQGRHSRGRPRDHEFHARARRHTDVIAPLDGVRRIAILIEGHSVDGHDAELLRGTVEQHRQIQVGDGGGVQNTPQLALSGFHLEQRRGVIGVGHRDEVDRKILGGLAEAGAVVGRIAVAIDEHLGNDGFGFRRRRVRVHQILIANDEYALRQTRDCGLGAFDALDDERAGGATQHLGLAEPMNVRMVPVQARRLVCGHAEPVFERRVAGLNGGFQHLVLMAQRRHGHAMKVKIGGDQRHPAADARVRRTCDLRMTVMGGRLSPAVDVGATGDLCGRRAIGSEVGQFVLEAQDEQVARIQAQSGRLRAVGEPVAVTNRAVAVPMIA